MSTAIVRGVIHRFIASDKAAVLVLRGAWGVGKTHFWKSCISEHQAVSRRRYSYVSMFGISTIQQLQLSVFINARDLKVGGQGKRDLMASATNKLGQAKALFKNAAGLLPDTWAKRVTFAIDSVIPHIISDLLICLDDFERLPRDGMQMEEVLGFVTTLKEEKNCKVVLIFNDAQLGERNEIYQRYREKVVDVDLVFAPTVAEAADLALPRDYPFGGLIREKLEILSVNNIRLIRRMLANVEQLTPLLKDAQPGVAQMVISMTLLLTWVELDSSANRPTLESIRKFNSMASLINRERDEEQAKKEPSPEERERALWEEVLSKFGFTSFDTCDEAIARFISQGFVEGSGLEAEIAKLKATSNAIEAEERFIRAWRIYHDSLEDDEANIVEIIDSTFDAAAPRVTPGNVDSTIGLLRNLGRDDLAKSLITRYMKIRGKEVELFDPDNLRSFGSIEDSQFREACERQFELVRETPTLSEALREIAKGRGWSQEQIAVLSNASSEMLYQAFKSSEDGRFTGMAKACLRFSDDPKMGIIAENAKIALKRIGSESRINRLRIFSKFGISPDI
jgi:hypothetical protein